MWALQDIIHHSHESRRRFDSSIMEGKRVRVAILWPFEVERYGSSFQFTRSLPKMLAVINLTVREGIYLVTPSIVQTLYRDVLDGDWDNSRRCMFPVCFA